MSPTTPQAEEWTDQSPRYLDQYFESRDHANQWDVSTLWSEPPSQPRDPEAE